MQAAELATLQERLQHLGGLGTRITACVSGVSSASTSIKATHRSMREDVREALSSMADLLATSRRELAARMTTHVDSVSALFLRYKKELAERRKLHNLVQELRGNIRVYCRARPVLPFELDAGASVATAYPADGEITVTNNKRQVKTWEFDVVFPPTAGNDDVFRETEPLITSSMDGA